MTSRGGRRARPPEAAGPPPGQGGWRSDT